MQSLKHPRWSAVAPRHSAADAARHIAALGLRSASAALARLARRLTPAASRPAPGEPRIEFCAEAGAAEGAVYYDGRLVGWIEGVRRL